MKRYFYLVPFASILSNNVLADLEYKYSHSRFISDYNKDDSRHTYFDSLSARYTSIDRSQTDGNFYLEQYKQKSSSYSLSYSVTEILNDNHGDFTDRGSMDANVNHYIDNHKLSLRVSSSLDPDDPVSASFGYGYRITPALELNYVYSDIYNTSFDTIDPSHGFRGTYLIETDSDIAFKPSTGFFVSEDTTGFGIGSEIFIGKKNYININYGQSYYDNELISSSYSVSLNHDFNDHLAFYLSHSTNVREEREYQYNSAFSSGITTVSLPKETSHSLGVGVELRF